MDAYNILYITSDIPFTTVFEIEESSFDRFNFLEKLNTEKYNYLYNTVANPEFDKKLLARFHCTYERNLEVDDFLLSYFKEVFEYYCTKCFTYTNSSNPLNSQFIGDLAIKSPFRHKLYSFFKKRGYSIEDLQEK